MKNNKSFNGVMVDETQAENIPGPVFVTNGSFKGEVYMQWDAVYRANHYIIEVSKYPGKQSKQWRQVDIVSDPHYALQGLTPGKSYSFRISAIFSEGQGAWSESVTKKIK